MSTLTTKEPLSKPNFFLNKKTIDWRYLAYLEASITEKEKVIYWIGQLSLSLVHRQIRSYPLSFLSKYSGIRTDASYAREVDGVETHLKENLYDLSLIIDLLLKCKEQKAENFYFFLEEKVDRYGTHSVSLLYDKNEHSGGGSQYGFAYFKKSFFDEKNTMFVESYLAQYLTSKEETGRIPIARNRSYNWLK